MAQPLIRVRDNIDTQKLYQKKTIKYAIFGIFLGLVYLLLATMVNSFLLYGDLHLLFMWQTHLADKTLWFANTAPIILGLVAGLIGAKQSNIKNLARLLADKVETQSEELHQAKNRLENILYNMADLIIVLDTSGLIKEINNSAKRSFGYEESDLLGKSAALLFGESDLNRMILKNSGDLFEQGVIHEIAGKYLTQYGHLIYLSISVLHYWDNSGTRQGTICVAQDISERREREEKLRESKEQFESLFNNAPLQIVIVQDHQIVFYNQEAVNHLKYPPEKFIGLETKDFVHPDDLERVLQRSQKPRSEDDKTAETIAFRVITANKETRWVESKSASFVWEDRPAVLNFIMDVTDRHIIQAALSKNEKKFRDLVQTLNVVILKADQRFRITFLNRFGENFFGFKETEILGKVASDIIIPEFESTGRDLHQLFRDRLKKPIQFNEDEIENIRKDGQRVWVAWRHNPVFDEKGDLVEIMSIGSDITDRKLAENKIKEQNRLLQSNYDQMTDELEQAKNAQLTLMPKNLPKCPGVRIVSRYHPMAQIGGDFYDVFYDSQGKLGILVGDVTGHGVPAALLSFLFLAVFKNNRADGDNPNSIVDLSNKFLSGKLPAGKYATIFYCSYDPLTRRLNYTNAGHPPGFLLRPDSDEIIKLQTKGMVVGFFEEPAIPFESKEIELFPGDKVIIYTDGIMEVFDENNRMQDNETLDRFLLQEMHQPINQLINAMSEYCLRYTNQKGFNDDVTIIGLEVL